MASASSPLEIRDLYGLLIDGMEGVAGAFQTGGDNGGNLEGNLPTQPPLALFSGVVKVGPDGGAEVEFDVPGFNGSVRVMAIAWSKTRVGSAEATVIVRDPVVVSATLPRFLNLGDRSHMHVDIDNVEGDAGDYRLDLDLHGPLAADADALSQTLHLAAHQARFRSRSADPRDRRRDRRRSISRPPARTSRARSASRSASKPDRRDYFKRNLQSLDAGANLTIADSLIADFVPGTGSMSISVSPFGALDAPALLQSLERYPYGCSEQTVSRAMPLLYVNKLASARTSRHRSRSRQARARRRSTRR